VNKDEFITFSDGQSVRLHAVQTGKPDAPAKAFFCPFCDGRLHRCGNALVQHDAPICKEWERK